jgi:hypothetical protein
LLVLATVYGIWNQAMPPSSGEKRDIQPSADQQVAAAPSQTEDQSTPPAASQEPAKVTQVQPQPDDPPPPEDAVAPKAAPNVESPPQARAQERPLDSPRIPPVDLRDDEAKTVQETHVERPAVIEQPHPKGAAAPGASLDVPMKGKLDNRAPDKRSEAVHYRGGTPKSEEAVEAGLRWLAAHQRDDGSWRFNHVNENCMHYCSHAGTEASTTASTGLALLPFLGAGYTHKQGEYQDLVQRALDYLRNQAVTSEHGYDLRHGSMYGQALATITLCEAYGLTRDEVLKPTAQGGIQFILYCQDSTGGGWRYSPGEPGDTTVTGWMLMALKSGQMAGLDVPTPAFRLAEKFLVSVQNVDGSQYGYMTHKPQPTTSAVGLLCRMYTGWKRDNPALQKGMAHLARLGPHKGNLYFNYYATQCMFHWGGLDWDGWNPKMRELLLKSQDQAGHSAGSWYFTDAYGDKGGRLYNTALAVMVLEVYYRYLPLYTENAVKGY